MSARNYNKLYVNTDREEGSEKILLGYQNSTKEIVLEKNKVTYFHVPFYAPPVKLSESTLIKEGATAGSFPAASDRIFQNRKGYGNTTTNGNTSEITDGTWFCSWLSKDEFGNVRWMDRYYNPGGYITSASSGQMLDGILYKKNNPVYRDVPSTLLLEPGVQYKYFHIGEHSAKELILTFGGISGERLKMDLTNWKSDKIDGSNNSLPVKIQTNGDPFFIFTNTTETDRVSSEVLSFENTYNIKAYVEYEETFNFTNEFTWAFWAYSPTWSNGQSTQLVGNYTDNGGSGVFIDTLSTYPFFVIPETGYGHLLYVNNSFNQFLDRSLHPAVSLTATPMYVAVDSDYNVVLGYADESNKIRKLNHKGHVIAENTFPGQNTDLVQILCGQHDSVIVVTKNARYTYDAHLNLTNTTLWQTLSTTVTTFAYNPQLDTAELVATDNVYDCKFVEMTKWFLPISDTNSLLVKFPNENEPIVFTSFEQKATQLAIDPFDRIWVMHGNNKISVYETKKIPQEKPVFMLQLGLDYPYARKNISFSCIHNRETNTQEWVCLIYYGDSARKLENPQIFVVNMAGKLIKIIDVLSLFDYYTIRVLNQDQYLLEFQGQGDFTGYEYRRVFNKLSPFKNEKQLVLRTTLKDKTSSWPLKQFKKYFSMKDWNEASWQHIILTLQNKIFRVCVNGAERITLPYAGNYEVDYETRPSFFIGTPVGDQVGFNEEIANVACIFNGKITDVKIYDYAIPQKNFEMFQRASLLAENLYWSCPTPTIQYMETVERMFQNKMPGAKSTFFNIKLGGTNIKDLRTRKVIEDEIRELIEKIKPSYANFLNVVWID